MAQHFWPVDLWVGTCHRELRHHHRIGATATTLAAPEAHPDQRHVITIAVDHGLQVRVYRVMAGLAPDVQSQNAPEACSASLQFARFGPTSSRSASLWQGDGQCQTFDGAIWAISW